MSKLVALSVSYCENLNTLSSSLENFFHHLSLSVSLQKIVPIVKTELLIISVLKYTVVSRCSFTLGTTTESELKLRVLTPSDTATYSVFWNDCQNVKKYYCNATYRVSQKKCPFSPSLSSRPWEGCF